MDKNLKKENYSEFAKGCPVNLNGKQSNLYGYLVNCSLRYSDQVLENDGWFFQSFRQLQDATRQVHSTLEKNLNFLLLNKLIEIEKGDSFQKGKKTTKFRIVEQKKHNEIFENIKNNSKKSTIEMEKISTMKIENLLEEIISLIKTQNNDIQQLKEEISTVSFKNKHSEKSTVETNEKSTVETDEISTVKKHNETIEYQQDNSKISTAEKCDLKKEVSEQKKHIDIDIDIEANNLSTSITNLKKLKENNVVYTIQPRVEEDEKNNEVKDEETTPQDFNFSSNENEKVNEVNVYSPLSKFAMEPETQRKRFIENSKYLEELYQKSCERRHNQIQQEYKEVDEDATLDYIFGEEEKKAFKKPSNQFRFEVYHIVGEIYKCTSNENFLKIREKYRDILTEFKATYPQWFEENKEKWNKQVKIAYDRCVKRWSDKKNIAIFNPLTLNFNDVFRNGTSAVEYLLKSNYSIKQIMDLSPIIAKNYVVSCVQIPIWLTKYCELSKLEFDCLLFDANRKDRLKKYKHFNPSQGFKDVIYHYEAAVDLICDHTKSKDEAMQYYDRLQIEYGEQFKFTRDEIFNLIEKYFDDETKMNEYYKTFDNSTTH